MLTHIYIYFVQDPKTLCGDLGLCNTTVTIEAPQLSVAKPIQLKPKATSGPGCALCEFAIEKLESMLSTNATEVRIVDDTISSE